MTEVKRPKENPFPTAQQEYKKENGHEAKHEETAKRAYNPDNLPKEEMKKQHEAIYLAKQERRDKKEEKAEDKKEDRKEKAEGKKD